MRIVKSNWKNSTTRTARGWIKKIYVTFHAKMYTNSFPLNCWNERLSNGLRTVSQAVRNGFIERLNGLLTIPNRQANRSNGSWNFSNGLWNFSNGLSKLSNGLWNLPNGLSKRSNGLGNLPNGLWKQSNNSWHLPNDLWNFRLNSFFQGSVQLFMAISVWNIHQAVWRLLSHLLFTLVVRKVWQTVWKSL